MNRSRKERPSMNSSIANKIKVENGGRKKELSRSDSSDMSEMSITGPPLVMSTPRRSARVQRSDNSLNLSGSESVTSGTDSVSSKKFHKTYDPNIELRQVTERFTKRQSNSWADQSLLNDEEAEDFQKYSDKLRKSVTRNKKDLKLEDDTEVLTRRQGDIDKGKLKQCYRNYVYEIGKAERKLFMPKTPNKFHKMSRRAWDGMVRKWKKHIHAWNEPNFDALYATGIEFDCCSESSMSVRSLDQSIDNSDDNSERQSQLFIPDDEEETLQGTKSRKRGLSPANFDKENCDEDTVEQFPPLKESKLRDLHSGLTNDAAALSVGPVKRMRLSGARK